MCDLSSYFRHEIRKTNRAIFAVNGAKEKAEVSFPLSITCCRVRRYSRVC